MDIVRNFPFFSIMICMFSAIVSSVLSSKASRYVTRIALLIVSVLSAILLYYTHMSGESFVYLMGHFPAPWGNEIRAGELEALMALFISVIALFSVMAGMQAVLKDIEEDKQNLYFILVDLMTASIISMIYTNDLFTGYVFIEINTIAGCGLIMIRQIGKSVVTAMRYMVISLVGSGLFLIGLTMLYTISGHLLMSNIQESVRVLVHDDKYSVTLTIIVGLITVGLAIKSGLFPFHLWIPDAYGYSNVASSSLLSSIVSKGYILLLIKIFYRVIGFDNIVKSGIGNILFVFGVIAMIMGSVLAIHEDNIRRMIAYSSIAQIGYIYMGLGLGTKAGTVAALFHIISHGSTKSLLFLASAEFTEGSHSKKFSELYGKGRKYRGSALCYSIGAFSMVGFPLLAGFISKLQFANAAVGFRGRMFIALGALAISTILNSIYFLRSVIILYSADIRSRDTKETDTYLEGGSSISAKLQYFCSIGALVVINFILGIKAQAIIEIISSGLDIFD